jgi:myo-inositol-1(or 4)-monophosphatase
MAPVIPDLVTLLPRVEDVVRAVAVHEIMPRFLQVTRQHKADGSALSEADLAAQRYLATALRKLADLPILGEEKEATEQHAALAAGDDGLWCFDPVDGSTNFVVGLPYFAVSVALLVGGRAVLGVNYVPFADEMFTVVAGHGARLNGQPLPLRAPDGPLHKAVACVDLKRLPGHLAEQLARHPPVYSQRNFGSSVLEWCHLAAGRVDVLLHGSQRLWDFAAGSLLVREAGGHISTFAEDDFDAADPWHRQVIASLDPQLFAAWRTWVREHLDRSV